MQANAPPPSPEQAGTWFTYPGGTEGWFDLEYLYTSIYIRDSSSTAGILMCMECICGRLKCRNWQVHYRRSIQRPPTSRFHISDDELVPRFHCRRNLSIVSLCQRCEIISGAVLCWMSPVSTVRHVTDAVTAAALVQWTPGRLHSTSKYVILKRGLI